MTNSADLAEDVPADRHTALLARLGIVEGDFHIGGQFITSIRAAVAHALAAPADGTPVPWAPCGARNIGGSIRALAQNPANPEIMYAGTGLGGVFRSGDEGDTWAALGNPEDSFPIGAIAVAPSKPEIVYVGSGDLGLNHLVSGATFTATFRNAAGRGLFRFDETAAAAGLVADTGPTAPVPPGTPLVVNAFARIVVDPTNHERCWMATDTGLWRREAGPVFHREAVPNPAPNPQPVAPAVGAACTDVLVVPDWNPGRPGTLRIYAAVGAVGIFRGVFDPAAVPPTTTWEPMLTIGLPAPSAVGTLTWDRIALGVCRSQPNHVYALAEAHSGTLGNNAVLSAYYSSDGGDNWTPRAIPAASLGTQSWYDLYIAVHPDNPSIALAGGVNLERSKNFGANWQTVIDWTNFDSGDRAQHADQHAAIFDVGDPRRVWVGNDGGLSSTPDIVQTNPHTDRTWAKRGNGILAAQFNDIAVHPTYPFMLGGGLQDNGTYITFGGESWYSVNGADGGQMTFDHNRPRDFIAPWQQRIDLATVLSPTAVTISGRRSIVNADQPPPNDVFATNAPGLENGIANPPHGPLFNPIIEHHPVSAGHFMAGRSAGGAYFTTDFGANYTLNPYPPALFGAGDVSALAYGNGVGNAADRWVGTTRGVVLLGKSPHAAANWTAMALPLPAAPPPPPPPVPAGFGTPSITRIAVHPASSNYVVVCTSGLTGANEQGRVYLTLDRGAHWADITGLASVGAPPPAPPLQALPPCPFSSLAFDPQQAAAQPQTLFIGTLAGVYVIRNLPRLPPAAGGLIPAFNPQWFTFNDRPVRAPEPPNPLRGRGPLPLTLVNDLKIVSLPVRTGADVVANSAEAVARTRLIAAMYGRGMYVCDISRAQAPGIPTGGSPVRLYIRQTLIEDGLSYPRPTPAVLNAAPGSAGAGPRLGGDPRFPINTVQFTDSEAFDIRIDNEPFQFFEDVVDGVEFDEELRTKPVKAGAINTVYVQVHSAGWTAAGPVTVHLYFAPAPAPGAPNSAPLPDLHADFWAHWTDDPLPAPAVAPVAPAVAWQRAGKAVALNTIGANQPAVARFDWIAPATLVANVALLAVCTSAGASDALAPAGQPTVMATLLRRERRAACRVAPVSSFVPDLFIRDGLDDVGDLGGVAFGGRSPDIIVVAAAPADPAGAFADLGDPRSADRVHAGADNFVYVRVHNRGAFDTHVDVELFWARPNAATVAAPSPGGPIVDNTQWQAVAAVGAVADVNVPANGTALVEFHLPNPPAPEAGLPAALAFVALIKAHTGPDTEPLRTRVTDLASFWRFFRELADSNNAALRAVRYG